MKNIYLLTAFLGVLILVLFLRFESLAQTGTIRGFVYEEETGEPVIFTNVYLYRTSYGAATDVNGYFVVSKVPPGDYELMVTYLGYDTLRMPISIAADQVITKQLVIKKASYMLDVVNITAEEAEAKTETKVSVIKITPKQIEQVPTIGGTPDLAQYLQVLPGVVFTGDQGGQLYIRGGSPVQNKVLMDGMTIFKAFHSIGLFSVFETDIIRNTDIYTGGFGAEYGGRISSVIDITTRDGNKKRIAGKVSASTFAADVLLEGPISKQKENGGGSASFILSAKHSYLDQTSQIFYDYIDPDGLPFTYTDLYGKISVNSANGSKVNFYGFHYDDKVTNFRSLSDYNWKSSGGGINFLVIPGKSPALMEGFVAYSDYKITLTEEVNPTRSSRINAFNVGLNFTYFLGKDVLKYGIELIGGKTEFDYTNSLDRVIQQEENTTELGIFVKYKRVQGKFLIEPSLRLQWYASLGDLSPEPRLALKYNVTSNLRLKMAGGFYSQNLISTRSDRDVVNLFYGFVSGPDNLPRKFLGEPIDHKLQKAQHIIFGVEYDVSRMITTNIEGYYKNFSQLTNLNRNKIYDYNSDNSDKPDYAKKDFIVEKGRAYGVDMSVKFDHKRLYIWAVYSLAWVEMQDEFVEYYPHYDRRHNVNFVSSYKFGSGSNWEVSIRYNFGSGFPFTKTQGFYEKLIFPDGLNSDYTTENGDLGIIYADINTGRLPNYHRFDINLNRDFTLGKYTRLVVDVGITNLFDRQNIFYIDRVTGEIIYQLPFMPSAGIRFYF